MKKIIAICLTSFALLLAGCSDGGSTSTSGRSTTPTGTSIPTSTTSGGGDPSCRHVFADELAYDDENHWQLCTKCGFKSSISAHDLDYSEVPPTFDEDGYMDIFCNICKYTHREKIDKLEHHYTSYLVYDEEYHFYQCTDEGYSHLRKDEAKHTFQDEVIDPTPEEKGYTIHTCTACGYAYTDSETEKIELEYSTEWSFDTEHDKHYHACITPGYTDHRSDEGYHQFTYWEETIAPGLYTKGEESRHCTICEYTETNELPSIQERCEENMVFELLEDGTGYKLTYSPGYDTILVPDTHDGLPVKVLGYYSCQYNKEIYLGANIEKIEHYSIGSHLEKIHFNDKLEEIEENTFYGCTYLEEADLSNTKITEIKPYTFHGCERLKRVVLPSTVESIGNYAFNSNYALEEINFPEGLTSIGRSFNYCYHLTKVELPSTLTSMAVQSEYEYGSFNYCYALRVIVDKTALNLYSNWTNYIKGCSVQSVVSEDGDQFFTKDNGALYYSSDGILRELLYYSGDAEEVTIDAYKVCTYSFYYSDVVNATINAKIINGTVFYCCEKLEKVTINLAESIQDLIAYDCENLTDLFIDTNNLEQLRSEIVGYHCENVKYNEYEGCKYLGNGDNPYGILFKASDLTKEHYNIAEHCKVIGENAFYNALELKDFALSDGIRYVGNGAFAHCISLETFSFNKNMMAVEDRMFYCCFSLRTLNLPSDNKIYRVGEYAFVDCVSLEEVNFSHDTDDYASIDNSIDEYAFAECKNLRKASFGSVFRTVGPDAFYGCSIDTIVFGKNLSNVNANAFRGCGVSVVIIQNSVFESKDQYLCEFMQRLSFVVAYGNDYPTLNNYAMYYEETNFNTPFIKYDRSIYRISGGAAKLVKCTASGNYEIPATVEYNGIDYPVTSIGRNAFYDAGDINVLTIPNTITSIESKAFMSFDSYAQYRSPKVLVNKSSLAISAGSGDYGCIAYKSLEVVSSLDESTKYITTPSGVSYLIEDEYTKFIEYKGASRTLVIPDEVTFVESSKIPDHVNSIVFGSGITDFGSQVTQFSCLYSITLSSALTHFDDFEIYKIFQIINKSSVTIETDRAREVISDESESMFDIDENGIVTYMDGDDKVFLDYVGLDRNVVLPNDITKADEDALREDAYIEDLTFGSGLKSLSYFANGAQFEHVILPYEISLSYSFTNATIDEITFTNNATFYFDSYGAMKKVRVVNMESQLNFTSGESSFFKGVEIINANCTKDEFMENCIKYVQTYYSMFCSYPNLLINCTDASFINPKI